MPRYDVQVRDLVRGLLAHYRLSPEERRQETDTLTQAIRSAVDAQLESLEHRRIA
jgi:hypothetical protein